MGKRVLIPIREVTFSGAFVVTVDGIRIGDNRPAHTVTIGVPLMNLREMADVMTRLAKEIHESLEATAS